MVLISEAEYRRLKSAGGMKKKMGDVLTGKRDHDAAVEMSQLFGRYLRTSKPASIHKLDESEILLQLPALYRDKVSRFLKQLSQYGSSWIDGQLISKSGELIGPLAELLKEAFVASRQRRQVPVGWKSFIQEINRANIPRNFFSKNSTRTDLQKDIQDRVPWENF
jgi:hypothetical protein